MAEGDLTSDQLDQLRNSVANFVARSVDGAAIRAAVSSDAGFSMPRWREMAALGWTSLLLPETFGGLGMSHAELVALHQEIGRAALPEPLAIVPLLVGQALARGINQSLAETVLPDLVAGEVIATLGWQDAPGGLDAADVGPAATRDGDSWLLSGTARFVPLIPAATAMIVAARASDGVLLLWLSEISEVADTVIHADGSRQASVIFNAKRVGPEAVIAGPEEGGAILDEVLDTARLAASAELLGLMERMLDMTLEHLRQRQQFGRPIGSFQALQHRAVDLFIQVELARSGLLRAARVMDEGATSTARAAQVSAAKSRAADAAGLVIRESIQMHGAIGYTAEFDLSLLINRALYLSNWLGSARRHRGRWSNLRSAAAKEAA